MRSRNLVTTVIAAVAAVAVHGSCSSSSQGRPTADEISESVRNGQAVDLIPVEGAVSKEDAECLGSALYDSRLSDEMLRAFVSGDTHYKASAADVEGLKDLGDGAAVCLAE
jgi:hypothetical protein